MKGLKETKDTKEVYEKRKRRYELLLKKQRQTINFISVLRLIVFAAGLGFTILTYIKKIYYMSAMIFLVSIIGFILLALRHNKVINNRKLATSIFTINDNSIKRIMGEWKQFQDKGEEFKDIEHNYSDDLDVFGQNSLFQWINTAQTIFGRNKLKEYLAFPRLEEDCILKKQQSVLELSKAVGFRHRFQAEASINFNENRESKDLINWASDIDKSMEKWYFKVLLYILPVLTITSSIYYLANLGRTYVIPLVFIMINMIFLKLGEVTRNKNLDTVFSYKKKIKAYSDMINLIEKKSFKSNMLKELQGELECNQKEKVSKVINKLSKIADRVSDRSNVFSIIFNIIFLWDYHLFIMLNNWKKDYGIHIENWLQVIGEFEALCSLSIINYDNKNWAIPKIEKNGFIVQSSKAAHPLLYRNAVANDIRIGGKNTILLITGSNMSGKSTYLRTIGINLVLAYAGAPVRAESFSCSLMNIYTCMRIGDNLEKSISSFYAEIIRIKSIVSAANSSKPVFFLLDEIFKGTNSVDRHLGAETLINELSEKNTLGLVSTHDLELGSLEETNNKIKNYNFQEYYVDDKISFDYKLREGVSKTRNAIYLMKLAGIRF